MVFLPLDFAGGSLLPIFAFHVAPLFHGADKGPDFAHLFGQRGRNRLKDLVLGILIKIIPIRTGMENGAV